jgi:hypothetical protein
MASSPKTKSTRSKSAPRPMVARGPSERKLAAFIAKFSPERAGEIRAARKRMRALLPNATEVVYDNYNFFVIGYGPNEKASLAIFSIAAQASGVSLCFLQGAKLPDPTGRLRGSGNVVRNVRLETTATIDEPDVRALITAALSRAKVRLDPGAKHQLIIKSVSAKQRPRRKPAAKTGARARTKTKSKPKRQGPS